MATGGVNGNGVKVAYSASSPVSWTSVGQLEAVKLPDIVTDELAASVHGSSVYHKSIPGKVKVGPLGLTIMADFNPSTSEAHDALRTYQAARTTIWWRIEVPVDNTQSSFRAIEFQGWVQSWVPDSPQDEKQMIESSVVFNDTAITFYAAGASAIS